MLTKPKIVNVNTIKDLVKPTNVFENAVALSTARPNSYSEIPVDPVLFNNEYSFQSEQLKEELTVVLFNTEGNKILFDRMKLTITGSKYIGIQQDQYKIVMQNVPFYDISVIINSGFTRVGIFVGDFPVFDGNIKTINTGIDSVVERTIEINCLRRVTDLLSDLVSPITVNSSINVWAALQDAFDGRLAPNSEIQSLLENIVFEDTYTFRGTRKTVIDDIIKITNDILNRTTNDQLPWVDYNYDQESTINLFGPYQIKEVLNMAPETGLIDAPQVSEDSITFSSIYKDKLVPGRVVLMNNALFRTIGSETAFIYAWDPNGLYVITEIRHSFNTYPNKYTVSCKARPLSKYNNFTASLEG